MIRHYLLPVLTVCAALLISSCTWHNEEDLYPVTACDTSNVTYALTIAPIMAAHCNTCHSGSVATGGVVTDNYASLSLFAKSGLLLNVVSHKPGYLPMPENGPKIPACDIAKIEIWTRNGSPEN